MIDLSIGNPTIFSKAYEEEPFLLREFSMDLDERMAYNKQGCVSELKNQILALHNTYHKNFCIKPDENTTIVVGHGATQLLMGIFQFQADKKQTLGVHTPYWFRTPRMAKMRSLEVSFDPYTNTPHLITLPNNPDGKLVEGMECDFYDTVYNWPWYYNSEEEFNNYNKTIIHKPRISVWSLGKFSGHCGSRIGWALVNDKELADYLLNYVEYDSGGVSIEGQLRGAHVINSFLLNNFNFDKVQLELKLRRLELSRICEQYKFTYNKTPGLFAWVTDEQKVTPLYEFFSSRGIKVMPGTACGGTQYDVRINLAEDEATWKAFLTQL